MNQNKIHIEKIGIDKLKQLEVIGKQTFFDTFSNGNTEVDMKKYLYNNFSAKKLSNELKNKNSEFYFAKMEKETVGYLKLNFDKAQTEINCEDSTEIERIYVLEQYQGKKVGQVLYETALRVAKERKSKFLWLGVWEKNPRAIRFYKKNGFVEFDKHIFVLGNDKQTDIMMRLMLISSS